MVDFTYYLTKTNSDLSGGADFSYKLTTATGSAATLVVAVAGNATEDSYGFTEPGVPGLAGATLTAVTAEINVTSAGVDFQLSVAVSRLNSSGVSQASSSFTSEQSGASTGVKSFAISNPSLGTWAAGDRLRVTYRFRRTSGVGAGSITIGQNTANEEVVTSFALPPSGMMLMF